MTAMDENTRKRPSPRTDAPIPEQIYPVLDTDLARDNVENDLTEADLQDLERDSWEKAAFKG